MAKDYKYTDIDFSFLAHPVTGDVVRVKDAAAVIQSIKTLILGHFYERKFHPEIGCNVHGLLFENISDLSADLIRDSIVNVLENYEPRASIVTLDVNPDEAERGYRVFLEVRLQRILDPIDVEFFLTRTR